MPDSQIPVSKVVQYRVPTNWISYDINEILNELIEAKVAIRTFAALPYQKNWFAELQAMQLKREVAGTSRIEGAEFTDPELDAALKVNASSEDLLTHSQRQVHAAVLTYRWISTLEDDRPVDERLVCEVHRRIVTGCDDDHCEPGVLRKADHNVTFGIPPHRGADGGKPCKQALDDLLYAVNHTYRGHDPLIQALAFHYHFAAMHPFMDGNGRTARAVEALLLQRADLTDRAFIAMSNYYSDEKAGYLSALSSAAKNDHNITVFLKFGLRGVALQCKRLSLAIRKQMDRAVFQNMMYDLFNRLQGTRTRVIAGRQIAILKVLLQQDEAIGVYKLMSLTEPHYAKVANRVKAFVRDISGLAQLQAISTEPSKEHRYLLRANLNWPRQITETEFFDKLDKMPKAKTHLFLQ